MSVFWKVFFFKHPFLLHPLVDASGGRMMTLLQNSRRILRSEVCQSFFAVTQLQTDILMASFLQMNLWRCHVSFCRAHSPLGHFDVEVVLLHFSLITQRLTSLSIHDDIYERWHASLQYIQIWWFSLYMTCREGKNASEKIQRRRRNGLRSTLEVTPSVPGIHFGVSQSNAARADAANHHPCLVFMRVHLQVARGAFIKVPLLPASTCCRDIGCK